MARAKAEVPEEMPGSVFTGRGRKSREHNSGASGVTVTRDTFWAEAETRLMEEIVSRVNMHKAYNRVVSNKGAAGDKKLERRGHTFEGFEEDLVNNLFRLWNRISSGSYFPKAVRRVEIPKDDGGKGPLGIPTI